MAPKPQFRLSVDGVITLQAKCLNGTCAIVYTYQPYGPQFEPLARVGTCVGFDIGGISNFKSTLIVKLQG